MDSDAYAVWARRNAGQVWVGRPRLMHPIWLARLDKTRPVLVLTREEVRAVRQLVTVAPITSTVLGLRSEVAVGPHNGLDHDSVVNLDSIATIPRDLLIRPVGTLLEQQEDDLTRAFHDAFDLADWQ